jgi:hypothetical protein
MGTLAASAQQKPSKMEKDRVEFKLQPNPVHDAVVFIESDLKGPKTVRIFDLFGKSKKIVAVGLDNSPNGCFASSSGPPVF